MTLKIEHEPGLLVLTDSSPVTVDSVRRSFVAVPALAREAGVDRILVDQRGAPNTLSTMERYTLGTEAAEHFRGFTLALVQDAPLRDPGGFGETVAVNRGAKLRIFEGLEEARAWLDESSADGAGD